MLQTRNRFIKKKGPTAILLEMAPGNSANFPGVQLQSLRTTLTKLSKQYPDRKYQYEIIDDKVIIECVK